MKILGSEEGYDLYAPEYRKDHSHLDSFDWDLARPVIKQCLDSGTKNVLDAGCGDGRVLKRLVKMIGDPPPEGFLLEGRDLSGRMLAQARKMLPPWVRLVKADIQDDRQAMSVTPALPAGFEGFDLICAFFVLVHIPRPLDAFRALQDWMKPGARLVCNTFPQKEAPVLVQGGHKFQIEYWDHDPQDLITNAAEAGLDLHSDLPGQWSRLLVFTRP